MKTAFPAIFLIVTLSIYSAHAGTSIQGRMTDDGCLELSNSEMKTGVMKTPSAALFPTTYDHLIIPRAQAEGIDPQLIKCIISVESQFKPDAVSVAGAMGLMQLMQDTAGYYNVHDPLDPSENLRAGISHFASLFKYFKGDEELALAAYHAGIGRVKKHMAIPPIRDTQEYVKKVMGLYGKKSENGDKIKRLYQKLEADGNLEIFTR